MTRAVDPSRGSGLSLRAGWAADSPIAYLMHAALSQPALVSLAAGFVDQQSLPVEATRSAALALLADPDLARAALQYGSTAGDSVLRGQVLAGVLAQDSAASDAGGAVPTLAPTAEQVVLTAGSNQLLHLLAEVLLDPGDIVLCDAPTYFVFMGLIRNMGARAVGIDSDEGGMRLDALEGALQQLSAAGELPRVKAIYVMTYFDNPRSVSLAPARRPALCELAKRYSQSAPIYVIEDAAYRELRYVGDDQASIRAHDHDGSTVVYAGTFSKSFSPGIRVGFGILPRALVGPVLAIKGNLDFGSPHLNQRIVSEALRLGLCEPHAATLREVYARKRDAMLAALARELGGAVRYTRPDGGLYVWAELNDAIDTGPSGPLFERALEQGVLYVPGVYCFPDATHAPSNCMRLSFGVQSEARIALGIERLARAIDSARARGKRASALGGAERCHEVLG
jgi:2-aminoadipate transaminase